jgi:hypothetical protein
MSSQRSQERLYLSNLVRHPVLAEDVSLDNSGPRCFGDIIDSRWQESISVIYEPVFRKKADEALIEYGCQHFHGIRQGMNQDEGS